MSSNRQLKLATLVIALGFGAAMPAAAASFSFGVMSDTQWRSNVDGENPGTVAVGIISQLNQQFITHDVKFVVQVGDLVDTYSSANMDVRASAAQTLYNAGIGFFPLRGNHEGSSSAANYVPTVFPQTSGSGNTWGASNFSSPMASLNGLSYSFDYGNARFVLLDQFTRTDGTGSTNNNIVDQLGWIDSRLDSKGASTHAFVFAHKELIGQNHTDSLFGSNPASNASAQNQYIASLDRNGVRYSIGGHDHMHHRSLVTSPDRSSQVQQIIAASDSYKFYVPADPSKDETYNVPNREQVVQQELYSVGYYVFNVDGPRVNVDFYASPTDTGGKNAGCGSTFATLRDCDLSVTPVLAFSRRETFGYSLNGQQFVIQPDQTFAGIADSSPTGAGWKGTEMTILAGSNGVSDTILDGRVVVQDVNTGWAEASGNLRSDVLSLWGMANDFGSDQTDQYVLSLSYDPTGLTADDLAAGKAYLMTKDANGNWVNAVDLNFGGTKTFVLGAYDAAYGLGTYGVNPNDNTAWAVLNHGSDFAVAAVPEPETYALMLAGLGLVGLVARRRRTSDSLN